MKNIKMYIIKSILKNLDIILFIAILTIKVLAYGRQIETNYFSYSVLFYPTLASIIIIAAIIYLFGSKHRTKIMFAVDVLISILLIADVNYFRYFKDILSIPVLKNGILLGPVKSSVTSLIKISDFLFIIDIPFLIPAMHYFKKVNAEKLPSHRKLAISLVLLIVGMGMNINYFVKLNKDQPRLLATMFNRIYIAKQLGIINAHAVDIYNFVKNDLSQSAYLPKEKEDQIKSFLDSNSEDSGNNMAGIAKGKNLIVIQVEALQQFVIGSKVNGQEVTPNLNRWLKKSTYFDNFYYQIAEGGTSDAEFMLNNSLYPAASGAAYYMYYDNVFNSLPKTMKAAGYSTAALHGYRGTFWNRDVMYKDLGFDTFYNENSYKIDDTVGLGLSDKSFLTQSISKLNSLKKPYFSFLITLSSHYPFDDVQHYGNFDVGEYNNTLLGNYLKAIHYTDEQLGSFLDELEKEGIADNSVIMLYGDHNAISRDKEDELAKFTNTNNMDDLQWMEQQKVPLMIHFPKDQYSGVNHNFGGEMDLFPTICNLFDVSNDDMMGKDLFNSKDTTVSFRNGSFTDGKTFYISTSDTFYDIKTGQKIPETEDLKSKKAFTLTQLEYSDDILKHDLLKKYNSPGN